MLIKYIFLKKEHKKNVDMKKMNEISELINPVYLMIKQLFKHIENKTFTVEVDGEDFKFSYKCTKIVKDAYYIKLETEYTPAKSAKVLNEVHSILTKGSHRKDFNIILSFDGASEYYCEKIFPRFSIFERKIRNLVFNILIQAFGIKWVEKAISDEIKHALLEKGVDKNKLVEDALHELTIYQLEKLLFAPYREENLSKLIDEELSAVKISKMEKTEIIEVISKGRSASLWERYFISSINIINLEDKLSTLREYRNSVAHHKYFSINDFEKCKTILSPLIKDLDSAIYITENKEISNIDMSGIISALSNMIGELQHVGNSVGIAVKQMAEAFIKIQYPKIQFDLPIIDRDVLFQNVQIDGNKNDI